MVLHWSGWSGRASRSWEPHTSSSTSALQKRHSYEPHRARQSCIWQLDAPEPVNVASWDTSIRAAMICLPTRFAVTAAR